jgi:sterol desaturase/sphingolipid hydroxylase (fatty acid hydroxylase superfamily)
VVALFIYFVADLNNALFFGVVGFAYYLMYETLHFSYHAKSGSFIKKLPFVEQSAYLHLLHHRAKLMSKYNFNITFPIFDEVFNTLYKG